ncbi:HAD-IA family hydrolase [Priestia endophytica]|uniref:HAD-IA family hydrolase n=1 Tax=Priestia endophytica TaxID=135735 RepID=UPI000F52736D|nr:HAD-IA family hydrolase [Priestia endophytica]RPK03148.1 Phosphoglycolate phosphatase [Priestia endophytica]
MDKTILFNFNGTIVDTSSLAIDIYNEIAEKKGYRKINDEEVAYLSTLSVTDRFKRLNVPIYKLPSLGITIKQRYQKYISNLDPVSGINEVIHELKKRGYRLGFLTTNSRDVTHQFLTSNSMNVFDYTHYSFNPFSKTKEISSFLKKNKLNQKDVLYIGDELRDIKAAKKNHLYCIAVSWGYDSKELLEAGEPNHIADRPQDILNILQSKF